LKGLLSRLVTMTRYKYCTTKKNRINIRLKYWGLNAAVNLLILNAVGLVLSMIYFLTKNNVVMSITSLLGVMLIWWMIYELNDYLVKLKVHLVESKKIY